MSEKVFKWFLFVVWLVSVAIFSVVGYGVIACDFGVVETVALLMLCLFGIVAMTVLMKVGMDVI